MTEAGVAVKIWMKNTHILEGEVQRTIEYNL